MIQVPTMSRLQLRIWTPFTICGIKCVPKLWKATNSSITSSLVSACNNSAPTGRIFMKFGICAFLECLSRNFKFLLNVDENTGGRGYFI